MITNILKLVIFAGGLFSVMWLSGYLDTKLHLDLVGSIAVGIACGVSYGLTMPHVLWPAK